MYCLLTSLHKGELVFNYNGRALNAKPSDLVRVLSEWSQKDSLDLSIRNIIVNTILSSENKQIGSGIICALALTQQGTDLLKVDVEKCRGRNYAEEGELYRAIRYLVGDGIVSQLAKKSLKLGLISADSVGFNLTYGKDFAIKQIKTKSLVGYIHPIFENCPKRIEGRILFIDGVIESVGEIDNFLQQCASSKENAILCTSGFSPDVAYTLYQNWEKGQLFVFPFVVTDWPDEGAEQFAESMGAPSISTSTGNILNLLDINDFSQNFSTTVEHNFLSISDNSGDDYHLEILAPGRYQPIMGLIEDRIKICRLFCRGIARTGSLNNPEISEIMKRLGFENISISMSSFLCGIKAARSCHRLVNNLGAVIILD